MLTEERSEKMWENQPCRHPSQWRRQRRRCFRCWSSNFPAARGADHGEAAVSLQPVEIDGYAEIQLQPIEETHPGAGGCPSEAVARWEAHPGKTCGSMERGTHTGAGVLAGLVTLWGKPAVSSWGTKSCWRDLFWSSLQWETADCGKTPCWKKLWSSHAGAREGLLFLRWNNRRNNVWGTDHNPHFSVPLCHWQGEGKESAIKLGLGRREEWEEGVFKISFTSLILLWS